MQGPECQVCGKDIGTDQDSTQLVCNAAGQTVQHTSQVHDKCWERFKKQFVRGRAGNRTANVFFCPVDGCHNSLHGQHTAVRQVEKTVDRMHMEAEKDSGTPVIEASNGRHRELSEAERRKREEALGLLEEVEDFEGRCQHVKADGTFCGRNVVDEDYGCCRIHLEAAKKKRALEKALSQDDSEEKRRLEAERREREEAASSLNKGPIVRERGINMDIGEKAKPAPAPMAASPEAAGFADEGASDVPAAPIKVAAWAAAKSGINQQKARDLCDSEAFVDPSELEDCPICMEVKAIIQLKPCNHAACDKCIDSWMLNSTSFAQTIRTGKSVTTCPLCRATVQDTVALAASAMPADDEVEGLDEMAARQAAQITRQRQQEIIAKAEAMRDGGGSKTSFAADHAVNRAPGGGSGSGGSTWAVGGSARVAPRDLQSAFGGFGSHPSLHAGSTGGSQRRAERDSNTSDAGGASNVQAMAAQLDAMMNEDDDPSDLFDGVDVPPGLGGASGRGGATAAGAAPRPLGAPGGLPPGPAGAARAPGGPASPNGDAQAGWESVGKGKNKKGEKISDAETERRKKEAEEARKVRERRERALDTLRTLA